MKENLFTVGIFIININGEYNMDTEKKSLVHEAITILNDLSDKQRLLVFSNYCTSCGKIISKCKCKKLKMKKEK